MFPHCTEFHNGNNNLYLSTRSHIHDIEYVLQVIIQNISVKYKQKQNTVEVTLKNSSKHKINRAT